MPAFDLALGLRMIGSADELSPFVVALTTAITAGAMLTMIIDSMIPEAFAETHNWAGLIAVLGYLVSFALLTLNASRVK